jgi:hypothetical protein
MFMPYVDARLFAGVLALIASACASPDPNARIRDGHNIARPSNSSVLYPGELRSQYEWNLWRLPEL